MHFSWWDIYSEYSGFSSQGIFGHFNLYLSIIFLIVLLWVVSNGVCLHTGHELFAFVKDSSIQYLQNKLPQCPQSIIFHTKLRQIGHVIISKVDLSTFVNNKSKGIPYFGSIIGAID